eukprot:gnl/Hemi2/16055_TR5321_c0_g1_i1.p1 gnl/Hemi2/16055_TR5321_c0_g1~~gnl/Hemi2/16055_TR5321_c0_g1_i1.p1  ORF type:complete len:581 (+),score=36.08 gnl/Hemi2/16055_TR5321_c0_g1_i1:73-1815(+)
MSPMSGGLGIVVLVVIVAAVCAGRCEDARDRYGCSGLADCVIDKKTQQCRLKECRDLDSKCMGADEVQRANPQQLCMIHERFFSNQCVDVHDVECETQREKGECKAPRCAWGPETESCFDLTKKVLCEDLKGPKYLDLCGVLPQCARRGSACSWNCRKLGVELCLLSSPQCFWSPDHKACMRTDDFMEGEACEIPAVGHSDLTWAEAESLCNVQPDCRFFMWKCQKIGGSEPVKVAHLPPKPKLPSCDTVGLRYITDSVGIKIPVEPQQGRPSLCIYTLPKGTVLYHGTHVQLEGEFPGGKWHPGVWFSADAEQACGHTFMRARGAVSRVCDQSPPFAPQILAFKTKEDIPLGFIWKGVRGHRPLVSAVLEEKKDEMFLGTASSSTFSVIYSLCHTGLAGWRAPWDEDEVMLCGSRLPLLLDPVASHTAVSPTQSALIRQVCPQESLELRRSFASGYRGLVMAKSGRSSFDDPLSGTAQENVANLFITAKEVATNAPPLAKAFKQFKKTIGRLEEEILNGFIDCNYMYHSTSDNSWFTSSSLSDMTEDIDQGRLVAVNGKMDEVLKQRCRQIVADTYNPQ